VFLDMFNIDAEKRGSVLLTPGMGQVISNDIICDAKKQQH